MKKYLVSNMCAILLIFAHFFISAPSANAQNIYQPSIIDGLRFDTPIPESYTKKNVSLYFLSSYDMKASELLTVKKVMPTPLNVTSVTTSESIIDLLVPPVFAEESPGSADIAVDESTKSATLVLATETEEPVVESVPSPTAKASAKVLATKSPVPTSKPEQPEKPQSTIAPTNTPVPTTAPVSSTPANPGGLNADKIFDLVNNYRASKGLPAVVKDERVCEVARSRAPEVGAEIAGGYMHRGIRARNLPYFNSEIIISMRTEEAAVQWWINDYIHRVQMEGDYKYSCAACSGNSCVQEFTNFTPKG